MKHTIKGEEIFESDAVVVTDAASSQRARDFLLTENPVHTDKESIFSISVKPEDAFQVFNGKIFGTLTSEYSIADSVERRVESPLQRYSRLRAEVDELKFDLDSMVEAESFGAISVWSVLQREATNLATATTALENHEAMTSFRDGNSRGLNIKLDSCIQSAESKVLASGGVAPAETALVGLEERVHRLETLLNSHARNAEDSSALASASRSEAKGLPSAGVYPLVDTITRLERRVAMLDAVHIEQLRAATATLKGDLDGALKAKSNSSADHALAENLRRAGDFVSAVQKVEAVAEDVPALVLRLKTLERIHHAAGTLVSRLGQMEEDVKAVAGDLQNNNDVLVALKQGFAENLEVMQQNVLTMDSRLAKLNVQ